MSDLNEFPINSIPLSPFATNQTRHTHSTQSLVNQSTSTQDLINQLKTLNSFSTNSPYPQPLPFCIMSTWHHIWYGMCQNSSAPFHLIPLNFPSYTIIKFVLYLLVYIPYLGQYLLCSYNNTPSI